MKIKSIKVYAVCDAMGIICSTYGLNIFRTKKEAEECVKDGFGDEYIQEVFICSEK